MSYQPLSQLVEWRQNDESISSHCVSDLSSVILDIPQSVEEITSCLQREEEENYGILSLACILLGHGFADEAHDLVTPLSWPEDTYFGYVAKPSSTYHSTSVDVIAFASYIHSLIHRYEGFEIGEYGMMGYANSKYWMNSALSSSSSSSKQLKELLHDTQQSISVHMETHYGTNKDIQAWYHDNIDVSSDTNWDPKVMIQLCQNVQKKALNTNQNKDANSIISLSQFSKECCEIELRLLLKHCLKHAGYTLNDSLDIDTASDDSMNDNNNVVTEKIDSYLAQKVANKISYAHIQSFASNDSVLLRRVWDSTEENQSLSLSVACGVACRLLETSCVSIIVPSFDSKGACDDTIFVHLPTFEINLKDGQSLTSGDVLATRHKSEEEIGDYSYAFQSCIHPDKAIFTDQFYGSRGSTPTTVIQWSKGTIF